MKKRKLSAILMLSAFMIICNCSFAGAIALPEGTETSAGVVTGISSKEILIRIDGQPYYFKDASAMDKMLKIKNISLNSKVIVFYKIDTGKKQVVNIEINRMKDRN